MLDFGAVLFLTVYKAKYSIRLSNSKKPAFYKAGWIMKSQRNYASCSYNKMKANVISNGFCNATKNDENKSPKIP